MDKNDENVYKSLCFKMVDEIIKGSRKIYLYDFEKSLGEIIKIIYIIKKDYLKNIENFIKCYFNGKDFNELQRISEFEMVKLFINNLHDDNIKYESGKIHRLKDYDFTKMSYSVYSEKHPGSGLYCIIPEKIGRVGRYSEYINESDKCPQVMIYGVRIPDDEKVKVKIEDDWIRSDELELSKNMTDIFKYYENYKFEFEDKKENDNKSLFESDINYKLIIDDLVYRIKTTLYNRIRIDTFLENKELIIIFKYIIKYSDDPTYILYFIQRSECIEDLFDEKLYVMILDLIKKTNYITEKLKKIIIKINLKLNEIKYIINEDAIVGDFFIKN